MHLLNKKIPSPPSLQDQPARDSGDSDVRQFSPAIRPVRPSMDHLDALEAQSIYIFREAFARLKKLALLWSLGNDSNV